MKLIACAMLIAFVSSQGMMADCATLQRRYDSFRPGTPLPASAIATARAFAANPARVQAFQAQIAKARAAGSISLPNGCNIKISPAALDSYVAQITKAIRG